MWKTNLVMVTTLMRRNRLLTITGIFFCISSGVAAQENTWTTARICSEIDKVAKTYNLPRATFTRLIWTESRFDIKARSPKGAQGIAQFMPATAKERGLIDPYEPASALEASGALLADLRQALGNFGLAAMAYNAGPGRVERWLAGKGGLPFETQDYVAAVTGQAAAVFKKPGAKVLDFSIQKGKSFEVACRALPVLKLRSRKVVGGRVEAAAPRKPWGVQVAGNFSRTRALRSWTRVRGKLGVAIGSAKPRLYRQRALRGLKRKWAVRIGANNRKQAIQICKKIRAIGGFCLVKKN